MERIASFRPGPWNGRNFSPQFVKQLYDNFQKYCTPDKSGRIWYTPYCNLNHKDELRFGRITKADFQNGTLYLWADQIPVDIAKWVNSHMLAERSIEFIEPKTINGEVKGFTGPDGKVVDGPVLKCLSLLGNDLPAVKDLPPLPVATYSDHNTGGNVLQFSNRAARSILTIRRFAQMNQQLVQQLQALGFDVSVLPQDTPDNVLQALIDFAQKIAAGTGTPAPATQNNMAGNSPTIQVPAVTGGGATPAAQGQASGQDIQSLTLKFTQEANAAIARAVAPIYSVINTIQKQNADAVAAAKRQSEKERDGIISRFFDRMGQEGRITPDARKPLELAAKALDYSTVRKFADGKADGTQLDEFLVGVEASHPVVRRMNGGNPVITRPHTAQTSNNNGDGNGVDTGRVNRILAGSQVGRKVLAARAKNAANN
jgi:hypothetical protein